MNKKIITTLILFYGFLLSCSANISNNNVIRVSGSDTMFELTSKLAENFMKDNPGISIRVDGGGTASGIKQLIKGETDICTASRNLKPEEAKQLAEYYGSLGLVFLIAKDALSIFVNENMPIDNLTTSQLKKIFKGEINNWRDLGGPDSIIQIVIRNPSSGTYLYFKDHVLEGEEYYRDAIIIPTTREIVNFIGKNFSAISYGGMGYKGKIKHIRIDGIEPIEANVRNDTYPISRYLHFFTTKSPDGDTKKFIDWVLSPAGQSIIRQAGFIPLWENKL